MCVYFNQVYSSYDMFIVNPHLLLETVGMSFSDVLSAMLIHPLPSVYLLVITMPYVALTGGLSFG